MNLLVDTSVWSLALRRSESSQEKEVEILEEAILLGRAEIIGPIRQELLSGVKSDSMFEKLRSALEPFPDIILKRDDFETAALFFNRCRNKGIQGSNTDFLICSVAHRRGLKILTTDKDFLKFENVLGLSLLPPD